MRNPTTADFGTESQKFLIRLDWPLFLASGAARMKHLFGTANRKMSKGGIALLSLFLNRPIDKKAHDGQHTLLQNLSASGGFYIHYSIFDIYPPPEDSLFTVSPSLILSHKKPTIDINGFAVNEIVVDEKFYGRCDVNRIAISFERISLTPGFQLFRR